MVIVNGHRKMKMASFQATREEMRVIQWIVVIGFFIFYAEVQAKELAIIANKAYPANRVTLDTLKDIYLGEKTMEKSVRILPVDQENPAVKMKFVEKILGMKSGKYDALWRRKAYTEFIVPPVIRELSRDVIPFVEREVGAIGYVWGTEAQGISGIKVLLTIEVGE